MFLDSGPGGWFPGWVFLLMPFMVLGMGLPMWFMMRMMMGMDGHDHTGDHAVTPRASRDARGVLDERYARGELTREQYQQMRSDLES